MRLASVGMVGGLLLAVSPVMAGKPAGEDVAGLVRALGDADKSVRAEAEQALTQCGPEAVPALRELLGAAEANTRGKALFACSRLGSAAKGAIVEVTRCLADPLPAVRGAAVIALGNMGPDAVPALPALEQLRDNDADPVVRRLADVAVRQVAAH